MMVFFKNGLSIASNFPSRTIIEMVKNDHVEIFIANDANANNLLVTELNVVIEALN